MAGEVEIKAEPATAELAAELFNEPRDKDLLRFITCGSVDDGKSTLIGRLLFDSQLLLEDQITALKRESDGRLDGEDLDLSLVVDGLQAEREQGITIDVAHRFFATARRKFIVADTPGHEQYTRNMVTGASSAQLAVLLVDARKGLLTQTRRHSYLAALLGIRHVVLAVNKMDAVDWDREIFEAIARDYRAFAETLGLGAVTCVPLSALKGDNVTRGSDAMAWYEGPTLLEHLENVEVAGMAPAQGSGAFRLPVQWISRPDQDFRGYAGTLAGGSVAPGDAVVVLPSGRRSSVERIVTYDDDLERAEAGQAITLTLTDEIDVARGDMIVAAENQPDLADQFQARIVWMSETDLLPGRSYLLQQTTRQLGARVTEIKHLVNVNTLEKTAAKHASMNDVAVCNIATDRPIAFDAYSKVPETGSFILIDRATNATLGCGMIEHPLRRATNVHRADLQIGKAEHAAQKGQKPCVLWFTGLSGSGKSTLCNLLEQRLHAEGRHTFVLDGDNVRHGLNQDLGFSDEDRVENIRRVACVAKLMVDAGLIVMVSLISPFRAEREMARAMFEEGEFVEVFVDAPLEVCEARDPKGLYKKARAGDIPNFTGIGSAYEAPEKAEVRLRTAEASPAELTDRLVAWLDGGR